MSTVSSSAGVPDDAVVLDVGVHPVDDSSKAETPEGILRRRLCYVQQLLSIENLQEWRGETPEAFGKAYREIYLRREVGRQYRALLTKAADVYQTCFSETEDARRRFIAGADEGRDDLVQKVNKLLALEEHDGWPVTKVGSFRRAFPWAYLAVSVLIGVFVAGFDPAHRRNGYRALEDGIKVSSTLLAIAVLIIKATSKDSNALVSALTGRKIITDIGDVSVLTGLSVPDIVEALATYPVSVPWAKMCNTSASRAIHTGKLQIDMACGVTVAIRRGYVITDKVIDTFDNREGTCVSAGVDKIHILWDIAPANLLDSYAIPYEFRVG